MKRAAFLALVFLPACGPQAAPYPAHYEYNFMQACRARESLELCRCLWNRIETDVPRADFEAYEELSLEEQAAHPLTREMEGFALACGRQEGTAAP